MDFQIELDEDAVVVEKEEKTDLVELDKNFSVVFNEYHDLLACRICLATDTKLISIHEFQLGETFENIIGYTVAQEDGFPQYLCHYCCTLLTKFDAFRAKYERSQFILTSAMVENQEITTEFLRTLDRKANELAIPLECHTTPEPIEIEYKEPPKKLVPIKIKANKLTPIPNDQLVVQKVQEDGREIVRVFYLPKSTSENTKNKTVDDEEANAEKLDSAEFEAEEQDANRTNNIAEHPNVQVVFMSKTEQIQEFRNRKKSVSYTCSFLKCEICYRGFLREKSYTAHMAMHDPSYGDFECDVCLIRSESAAKLRAHCRAAHQRKYVCRLCGRVDTSPKSARVHQTWHEGDFFKCTAPHCNMTFRKAATLLKHTMNRHSKAADGTFVRRKAPSSTCTACEVTFSSPAAHVAHLASCAAHQEGQGDKWYPCKHCGESFETQARLANHSRTHDLPIQCDECEFSFLHERGLAIHKGQAHKATPRRTFINPRNICEFCGREMETADDLAQHKLTHTGEKPFECYVCNKTFKLAPFLQIHMRVHTKEAPYVCSLCERRFTHKANLNRHYKVHTGEKPFVCDICNHTFTQSNSLKLHIRTVHLKLPDPYRQNRKARRQRPAPAAPAPAETTGMEGVQIPGAVYQIGKSVEELKEEVVEYTVEEEEEIEEEEMDES